ncbi:unnamed protein product [Caenorhabditis sp. 36 PRJEB53466]|nr:unnamed protein product [Caenorhabditis sp. 36 PRJEB53466]
MLMMSAASKGSKKFEIDEIINRFLISVSEREKFLGILAILMKVQVEMNKKHCENQEKAIREGVERIEEAVKTSSRLRGAFYEHMAQVVEAHKRGEEIRYILEWTEQLMKRFKEDFFEENTEETMEEETSSQLVLKPRQDRLPEVSPMFNLIKELLVLKLRWNEDDDAVASSYDVCVIKDLNFAFEAVVSLDCDDIRSEKLDHLFFLIQWSRTILNGFLAQSSLDFLSSEQVSKISTKLFYLMMDSEKKLAALLTTSQGAGSWKVPNVKFEKKEDVIMVANAEKKSGRGRPKKRKSDETMVETEAEEVTMNGDEEDADEVKNPNATITTQLKIQYVQLKLRPIAHLMKLAKAKRSCLIYLCDELQTVLEAIVKMRKKSSPMLAARASTQSQASSTKLYHGDFTTVWFCVKKAVEQVWSIVELVFDYFSELPDASQEANPKVQKDLEDLGHKSLHLLHTILTGELYGSEEKLSATEKTEKKSILVRIMEKKMKGAELLSNDVESARRDVGKYLAKMAEFAPSPAVAVSILDVFEDLRLDPDGEADVRKTMAKFALAYLKKDWSKVDEIWSKGTKLNAAVRDILTHYIRLRRERDQLAAIQWILTNKVVQLVPEDDKRKSCVFSQQSDDDLLEKDDQKATFYCINKGTFGVVFKTIFSGLNARVLKHDMSATAAKNGGIDDEETLESWETASSCFLILCLLLRVNKIRTTAVLTTAVREGKQFLITVSKRSSFIYLMDNITKGTNFDAITKRVDKILSAVQQGNRVLQSIGNYAKTNKCVHLLKKFPELRAESENCLRVIHSAMVKNECLNAFTVGLVKSRSIDGEIILEERESSPESDEED